jgi:hypothetical protein
MMARYGMKPQLAVVHVGRKGNEGLCVGEGVLRESTAGFSERHEVLSERTAGFSEEGSRPYPAAPDVFRVSRLFR